MKFIFEVHLGHIRYFWADFRGHGVDWGSFRVHYVSMSSFGEHRANLGSYGFIWGAWSKFGVHLGNIGYIYGLSEEFEVYWAHGAHLDSIYCPWHPFGIPECLSLIFGVHLGHFYPTND